MLDPVLRGQEGVDAEREDHVHDHACRDHERASPYRLLIEVPRARFTGRPIQLAALDFLHDLVVHPAHLHVPAERNRAQHVLGLTALKTEHAGSEADREALDLDADGLGGPEVSELVHENEHAQNDDGGQYCHELVSTLSLPSRTAISCATTRAAASAAETSFMSVISETPICCIAVSTTTAISGNRIRFSRNA